MVAAVVLAAGAATRFGAPKQRLLLGTLALAPGAVSTDTIVSVLWRDDPPEDARAALHVHVSKLRRSIAGTGATVHRDEDGYALIRKIRVVNNQAKSGWSLQLDLT